MKRCTNCGRFPFCNKQKLCTYNKDNKDLTQNCVDYWVKREVSKDLRLDSVDDEYFKFERI